MTLAVIMKGAWGKSENLLILGEQMKILKQRSKTLLPSKPKLPTKFGPKIQICLYHTSIFSEVFKARCKKTGRYVALKKILMENEKEGVSCLVRSQP
jgi:hypothetical protein